MRLLLDTHTFIWWDSQPNRLSPKAFDLCQDQVHTEGIVLVSQDEVFTQYPIDVRW